MSEWLPALVSQSKYSKTFERMAKQGEDFFVFVEKMALIEV